MATRIITKILCDRCSFGREKEASTERVFCLDELWYELNLCEDHAKMFDRDWTGWTRLATDIDPPSGRERHSEWFSAERKRETERIRELRDKANTQAASAEFALRRAAEIELETAQREELNARQSIPGALEWRLVNHARERMLERGFTIHEVLTTAASPGTVVRQPWRGPDIAVHQRGDCRVVVNDRTKAIITVINRGVALETEQAHAARQASTQKASGH